MIIHLCSPYPVVVMCLFSPCSLPEGVFCTFGEVDVEVLSPHPVTELLSVLQVYPKRVPQGSADLLLEGFLSLFSSAW